VPEYELKQAVSSIRTSIKRVNASIVGPGTPELSRAMSSSCPAVGNEHGAWTRHVIKSSAPAAEKPSHPTQTQQRTAAAASAGTSHEGGSEVAANAPAGNARVRPLGS